MREGPDGTPVEVLPAPWNVRNRVHEYGGRPWTVLGGRLVVFTHWADQRVYVFDSTADGEPRPLTPEPARHHGSALRRPLPRPGQHLGAVRARDDHR